jgi:NADPH-dependent 2,4-dienoyl-CoA reductase/sulfur reductase-like enzyme
MTSQRDPKFEVLVVGAGPAGIAAAVCAAECGKRVALVDDNFKPGGQIWRGTSEARARSEEGKWRDRLQAAQIATFFGYRIVEQLESEAVIAESIGDSLELRYDQLILATGARERFLPFDGWTLPNVLGAGGLQALIKSGLPIRGKRVVVAGSGPLLLAVADFLHQHGAEIPVICEQASRASLARFGVALLAQPAKIRQALQLKRRLAGIPFVTSAWPVAAQGKDVVEFVTISRHGRSQTISCDYLACGFHLVPNIELASLLGCEIKRGYVRVDDFQQTTIPGVFCAGEPTSIGGVELALVEGQIAGLAASGRAERARILFAARNKLNKFSAALESAFRLRPELRDVPTRDTLVCRCEDVSHSQLQPYSDWRAAKLQTRCGMGPCQGRVCGPATQFLFNWNPDSVRAPIFPARVDSLAPYTNSAEAAQPVSTGGQR